MNDASSSTYLNGRIEYQQALDTVIEHARHSLRIFDYDLRDGGYNAVQRYERFKRFCGLASKIRLRPSYRGAAL